MLYILIEIDGIGRAYQEVSNGAVVRYLDANGKFLFNVVPAGKSSKVVDANPPKCSWM